MSRDDGPRLSHDLLAQVRQILEQVKNRPGPATVAVQTVLVQLGLDDPGSASPPVDQSRAAESAETKDSSASAPQDPEGKAAISKAAQALALLIEHPEWTDTQIAKVIHVARSTLYTWPQFRTAKAWLRSQRQALPRGCKNSDGRIEAYVAESEEERAG